MTEKEKRYLGLPHYLFKDPEIFEEMAEIKDLCFKYNQIIPSNKEARNEILEKILQNKTENVNIWAPFQCFHGKNIKLGKNFFSNHNLIIIDMCEVVIGDNVMFGPNVTIVTANHPKSPKQREENLEFGAKVIIEDNVWIAAGVTVCPGVTIGKNSIIGAGSVVTKNIPKNVVAYGVPCKVIEKIEEEQNLKGINKDDKI